MKPIVPILLFVGGAIALTVAKTIKAAKELAFKMSQFSIYNLYKNGNLVFRAVCKINNPNNTPLHVQNIDFGAYINAKVQNNGGKITIVDQGKLLCSLTDAVPFTIAAGQVTQKEFYIEAKWSTIGDYFGINVSSLINIFTGGLQAKIQEVRDKLTKLNILISGTVHAEDFTLPINQLIQITNN